ncbi:MAG: D-glucuronyl C5-epimerase family protein [Desulfitobacteriaceae bacterium]|nr:D-glucuronyl C5-epimerase family protein [Desulfitobacteriaceae bacterium]MDI6878267.1 D-glucuronyl C5-epimerase family protein [Desulfitobacteriaceae bacterium]MDI6913815.1 D-glucuronyl C5-epimerase family protein [Desulfitobacteriaceae bacterium]
MNIFQMVKAYGGMVFGKTDYWHPDMKANPALSPGNIGKYPVDMSSKASYIGVFDEGQIPMVEIDGHLSYLPVTIAQYALGHYDAYLETGKRTHLEVLLLCADWFVERLVESVPGVWGWLNEHDKDIYALKSPWLSALSQGQALSVLARAYVETQDEKYLHCGERSLKAFSVPVADGGLVAQLQGEDFYEEYPSVIPSYVLNGLIFALWGLWDFYLAGKNAQARERYATGLQTLQHHLGRYDRGWLRWSLYDRYPFRIADIASIFYHKLHIQQLRAMSRLTGDERFNVLAERWEKGRNSRWRYILATAFKILHKLSIRRQSSYVAK